MKTSKKLLTGIILVFTLMLCLAFGASAAVPESGLLGNYASYTYDSSTGTVVISGNGAIEDYDSSQSPFYQSDIKSVLIEDGITEIGSNVFSGCRQLENISIPSSVKIINNKAFYRCSNLQELLLPEGLESIGINSFGGCFLLKTDIPSSVKNIDAYAFYNCDSIVEITIPDGIKEIKIGTFNSCSNLKSVTIPKSVEIIDEDAFIYCDSLAEVVIPDSVTQIGKQAFSGCTALESVILPKELKIIEESLFKECNALKSVVLPDGIISIGKMAFSGCTQLSKINIPDGIVEIGNWAFEGCSNIASVVIPDTVTVIGEKAFSECEKLNYIKLSNSIEEIKKETFYGCRSLVYVNVPDSVTMIGEKAFYQCYYLKNIDISNNLQEIGPFAFAYCSLLEKITIPESVKKINVGAFDNTNSMGTSTIAGVFITDLAKWCCIDFGNRSANPAFNSSLCLNACLVKDLVIPYGVENIGAYAFQCNNALETVFIPESVSAIGSYTFSNNSIKSITLTDSVNNVYDYSFYANENLKDIYFYGTEEEWTNISVSELGNDALKNATVHFCSFATNGESGIKVEYMNEGFSKNPEFKVGKIANATLASEYDKFVSYDLSFVIDGEEFQPKDKAFVRVPIPSGFDADHLAIYYIDNTGNKNIVESYLKDGYIVFITDLFGEYAVVDESVKHVHIYETTVTEPTCTEGGFITYTCSCGDTYRKFYAYPKHNYKKEYVNGTCTVPGYTIFTCICGDSYIGEYTVTREHIYSPYSVSPTCIAPGILGSVCYLCGEIEIISEIPIIDEHTDLNCDGICDYCGFDNTENCTCNCHKGGISGFIWKILRIIYKLFKINPVCACGLAHY